MGTVQNPQELMLSMMVVSMEGSRLRDSSSERKELSSCGNKARPIKNTAHRITKSLFHIVLLVTVYVYYVIDAHIVL